MLRAIRTFMFTAGHHNFISKLNIVRTLNMDATMKVGSNLIAVTQMTSGNDKDKNFSVCHDLVTKAAIAGAKVVFLPEGCDYIAESMTESLQLAESWDGPLVSRYKDLARSAGVWLSVGGIHIRGISNKTDNTHILIDSDGQIVSSYVKAHLFNVNIADKNVSANEGSYVNAGNKLALPVDTPVGKLSLAICYDLRFPELSLIYRRLGAHLLTFPSAFHVVTGMAHWETLLRARAIENQCYVVAAAQIGQHNGKRSSYGHAMVIDPWGAIVAQVGEGAGFSLAPIDVNYVDKVRREMPLLSQRRNDLYQLSFYDENLFGSFQLLPFPSDFVTYSFSHYPLPGNCVFAKSRLSMAIVNKKCLVPGHVLVIPERPVKCLCDVTPSELTDLAQLVQGVQLALMEEYSTDCLQMAIQNGQAAGQTVEHLHLHIQPWDGIEIESLQNHSSCNTWRENDEMALEAANLRKAIARVSWQLPLQELPLTQLILEPLDCNDQFKIGDINLPNNVVFMKSAYCSAYVTADPIHHGHVCVFVRDSTLRLCRLDVRTVTDLFLALQLVEKTAQEAVGTSASTVYFLDSSQGVIVHIVPRKEGDAARNDDIYSAFKNVQMSFDRSNDSCYELTQRLKETIYRNLSK